jgi:hypothetical protein
MGIVNPACLEVGRLAPGDPQPRVHRPGDQPEPHGAGAGGSPPGVDPGDRLLWPGHRQRPARARLEPADTRTETSLAVTQLWATREVLE